VPSRTTTTGRHHKLLIHPSIAISPDKTLKKKILDSDHHHHQKKQQQQQQQQHRIWPNCLLANRQQL
jgi:hypothetical protein